MKKNIGLIILAGGKGTRMNQDIPKVLTELDGVCLIEKLLESVEKFFSKEDISIVVGYKGQEVIDRLKNQYNFVWQREQLGTGHAVSQCKDSLIGKYDSVLILYGDMPFITEETLKSIMDLHYEKDSIFTMITLKLKDFENENSVYWKFGRVIRNESGDVIKIVEFKDALEEEKKVTEVNPAIYCMKDNWLWKNLDNIKNNNSQSEYYLPDLVLIARDQQIQVQILALENNHELMGINTQEELNIAKRVNEPGNY